LGATVQWNPSLIEGKYKVAIYNIAENADPNAKLMIVHNGIEETKTINLNTGTDGWIELGNFYFATGNNDSVSLTLMTAGKNVRVNAVRFTR
jgi:hypothetical protein